MAANQKRLIKSPHLIIRQIGIDYLVYNSLFGFPTLINSSSLQLLDIFRKPVSIKHLKREYSIEDLDKWIQLFKDNFFIIEFGFDEREYIRDEISKEIENICSGKKLVSLGLILDESCNFNCRYCVSRKMIEISQRSKNQPTRMDWYIAKKAVDNFAEYLTILKQNEFEIYFGGSEPLLNWKLIKKIIKYCEEKYSKKFDLSFSTNTNSSLITFAKAEYITEHNITVTTSLDGVKSVNDSVRYFKNGEGAFRSIMLGWDNLNRAGKRVEWFCLTLVDENIDFINEYFFDFIKDIGIKSCSIEPDLIFPLKSSADKVARKLLEFKKLGEEREIIVGGLWDKPAKNMFKENLKEKIFNCSAFTGRGISVLPSGDVIPCSYSSYKIGHINNLEKTMQSSEYKNLISSRALGSIKSCQGCEIEGQCMGGCFITTEFIQKSNLKNMFNYRCGIFKKATKRLLQMAIG